MFVDATTPLDMGNEDVRSSVSRLGALIYSDDNLEASLQAIAKRFNIMTVKVDPNATALFAGVQDGEDITVDFNNGRVYKGDVGVKVEIPAVASRISVPRRDVADVKRTAFSAVLSSAKFYQTLKVHPLAFLAYDDPSRRDRLSEEARRTISDLLSQEGVTQGAAFLKKRLIQRIELKLPRKEESSLLYETMDLQSDDLVALSGHELFLEEAEVNPPLGFAGLDALMKDEEWRQLFVIEMSAVKEAADKGYQVAVQFNSVKIPESLQQAVGIIREMGIDTAKVRLGMNTAWPGNYLFPKDFLGQLSFVTIDDRKLTQGYLAADVAKNVNVRGIYNLENESFITRPKRMIEAAAKEMGIPVRHVIDSAMANDLGGIDMNAQLLDLQIKRDGQGMPLPVALQPIGEMNIDGLSPVIVTITPFNPVFNLSEGSAGAPVKSAL